MHSVQSETANKDLTFRFKEVINSKFGIQMKKYSAGMKVLR